MISRFAAAAAAAMLASLAPGSVAMAIGGVHGIANPCPPPPPPKCKIVNGKKVCTPPPKPSQGCGG